MPIPTIDMIDASRVAQMGHAFWGNMEEPWPGFFTTGGYMAGAYVIDGAHLEPEVAQLLMRYSTGKHYQITPRLKPHDGFYRSSSMNDFADVIPVTQHQCTDSVKSFDRNNTIFLLNGPIRCLVAIHLGFLTTEYGVEQALKDFDQHFAKSSHQSMQAREMIANIE